MKFEIKSWLDGGILFEGEFGSLKPCVESAVRAGKSLDRARLDGAKNLRMPSGETWEEYVTQTVPALLTAGGKALDEVANEEHWDCHDWDNCPIKTAFDAKDIQDVPPLYRQQASLFVSRFQDMGRRSHRRSHPERGGRPRRECRRTREQSQRRSSLDRTETE